MKKNYFWHSIRICIGTRSIHPDDTHGIKKKIPVSKNLTRPENEITKEKIIEYNSNRQTTLILNFRPLKLTFRKVCLKCFQS